MCRKERAVARGSLKTVSTNTETVAAVINMWSSIHRMAPKCWSVRGDTVVFRGTVTVQVAMHKKEGSRGVFFCVCPEICKGARGYCRKELRSKNVWGDISGFRRDLNEFCAHVGYFAAYGAGFLDPLRWDR